MKNYEWINRNEYPYILRNFINNENYNFNYIDEGNGKAIVFVHGTPDWSFSYRNIINELQKEYRCIAFDNLGFGLSDKPNNISYSIEKQSKRLEEFIKSLELQNITLVCHDFGGPIAFGFAIRNPNLVENILIMNTWMWDLSNDKNFIKTKFLHNWFGKFLYLNYGLSAKYLIPSSYYNKKILSKTIHKMFLIPLNNPEKRYSTYEYAKELLNSSNYIKNLYENKIQIESKKIKILWGMNDPYFKPYMLDKFISIFPLAEIIRINECGHFICEEKSEIVVNELKKLIR